jgi:hypothetical protein
MGRTLVLLGLALFTVLALTWAGCVRHDRVAARGEELRYDDFAFSVQDVRQAKTIGRTTAKGSFWIVDVRVANHAKRVSYAVAHHQLAVLDDHDDRIDRIDRSPEGEAALAAEGGASPKVDELAHGESCITRVVFDVPESVKDPRLKIRFGDFGTIADDVLLGDWSIALR